MCDRPVANEFLATPNERTTAHQRVSAVYDHNEKQEPAWHTKAMLSIEAVGHNLSRLTAFPQNWDANGREVQD